MLHNAGVAPPYILVGHSMAAYNIRLYASLFKSDVAGIALVDGCHPDQLNRFPRGLNAMNPGWIRQRKFLVNTIICFINSETVKRALVQLILLPLRISAAVYWFLGGRLRHGRIVRRRVYPKKGTK